MMGVLLRFRENSVAVVGDISKMYHQIAISEEDQHVHRFLWRNLETSRQPDVYVMKVLTFGDKPAPAMALSALRKSAEAMKDEFPEASDTIQRNSYMDDVCDSVSDYEGALRRAAEVDGILNKYGFQIKKWTFSRDDGSAQASSSVSKREKVLGLMWDPQADDLALKVSGKLDMVPLTKRKVLGQISKVFDPLGLAAALVVRAKIAMQDLWRTVLGWDDEFPPALERKWRDILQGLSELESLSFPRCVRPAELSTGEPVLCIFSDASEEAFGACAYVRWELESGEIEVRLMSAKSRVAPLKKLTVPKLELQAAVIASRLFKTVRFESRLNFSDVRFFTDSMIVLGWLRSGASKVPFVSCRVKEILLNSASYRWDHIPGRCNVVDQVSRGITADQLQESWFKGPEFLRTSEEDWPVNRESSPESEVQVLDVAAEVKEPVFFDCERTASWRKMKRVAAYVLRFLTNVRSRERRVGPLLVDELERAEIVLLKEVQVSLYEQYNGGKLKNLTPFVDEDGLLRVGGRVDKADFLTYDSKHPVLVPARHPVARMLVLDCHKQSHSGIAATVARSRRKFWICKAHVIAKSVVRGCVLCKKLAHKAHSTIMASLPTERLQPHSPPFYHTAVDYFGPLVVKISRNKTAKYYGVIFTCMNCRAVHLEIATDASADEFVQVLRRFFAVRGFPSLIMSDNGTQMVGAERALREIIKNWNKEKISDFCANKGTRWQFTTPLAPHQNGCAESLVKTCKKALKHAVGEQKLAPFELYTLFVECANIVNQRPLGRVTNDPNDGGYLCPNDLLLGRASSDVPPGPFRGNSSLRDRVGLVQQLVDSFWKRWSRDVLPLLFERKKWQVRGEDVRVGDVVVTADSNPIRGKWELGRVEQVFKGSDGVVRNVAIKVGKSVLRRPITKVSVVLSL